MCPVPLLQTERNSKAYLPLVEGNSNVMDIRLKGLLGRESDGFYANTQSCCSVNTWCSDTIIMQAMYRPDIFKSNAYRF